MSAAALGPDAPLAPGDRVLDRYVVIERFETGGTSIVYRGEDERLSRPVCIKVFHTLRDKEWLYRTTYQHFVQEAFALSRLSHPNTLRIYDFGHMPDPAGPHAATGEAAAGGDGNEGLPFQVSEFMNGGTLSQVVRREGPLPPSEAQRVVAAISGALDEAHHAGIIHRDIKPKNILFGTTGQTRQAKLADFGIAKSLALDADADAALRNRAGDTQVVAGRRLLMLSGLWASPEQLAGRPVGAASDIYSWALVTIFMLTGQAVFSTNDPVEAHRERREFDRRIDEALRATSFPPAVAALFKRACDLDPGRRPVTAGELAEALAEAFDRRPGRRFALPSPDEDRTLAAEPAGAAAADQATSLEAPAPALTALPSAARAASPRAPRRLSAAASAQTVGDRLARFLTLAGGVAELSCAGGRARLRLTLVPTGGGFSFHVRGLDCFVCKAGGPPTGATQFETSGRIELVGPDRRALAAADVLFGSPAAGHQRFAIGGELVAISTSDVQVAVALDFGAGGECVFVHLPRSGGGDVGGGKR